MVFLLLLLNMQSAVASENCSDVLASKGKTILLFLDLDILTTCVSNCMIHCTQLNLSEPTLDKSNHILVILGEICVMRSIVVVWQDRTTLIVTIVTVALQRAFEGLASSWV